MVRNGRQRSEGHNVKLTKIESYEIQAFAFRVMTGYTAPGKDVSPLAYEAPYEERCAAFDEWRKEHAPCILAMLLAFEALIDRDGDMPPALRIPEPMTPNDIHLAAGAELAGLLDHIYEYGTMSEGVMPLVVPFARAIESETLRRVKEANE